MMLHIKGLVVSDNEGFVMFSYLAYVNHMTPGTGPFLAPGHNLDKCGRGT